MSADGPGTREVAHRLFAAEFDDASLSYSESDEERAPNYVVTPTGARVNRLFVAGVLTEVERVNDETRRGRVVDPSGAFVTYAGQYQPEAQTFLERADPPAFVALTGKARTFEPEDSDRVFTSVRPESLTGVDADTRDRWVVSAAEATLDRLAVFAAALDSPLRGDDLLEALEAGGAPAALADGIPRAIAHYDTSTAYVEAVRRLAVDALEMIAGDRDEVRAPEFAPDGGGDAAIGPLPETDVSIDAPADAATEASTEAGPADASLADPGDAEPDPEPTDEGDEPTGATAPIDATPADETDATAAAEPAAGDGPAAGESGTEVSETDESGVDEPEAGGSPSDEGLGDFDAGTNGSSPTGPAVGGTGDDGETDADDASDRGDPSLDIEDDDAGGDDMYELDDEEREEIEAEYGTDFSTGTEVDEPGEADIDVPDPDEIAEGSAAATDADDAGGDPVGTDAGGAGDAADATVDAGEGDAADDAEGVDVDLEAAVVDAMTALDDGDGADREAVVGRVVDEHGTPRDAVDDAIQGALMSGKCYEPGDGVLKPI